MDLLGRVRRLRREVSAEKVIGETEGRLIEGYEWMEPSPIYAPDEDRRQSARSEIKRIYSDVEELYHRLSADRNNCSILRVFRKRDLLSKMEEVNDFLREFSEDV